MTEAAFAAEVYQNAYLPAGATVVDAVVTVTASGGAAVRAATAPPSPSVTGGRTMVTRIGFIAELTL